MLVTFVPESVILSNLDNRIAGSLLPSVSKFSFSFFFLEETQKITKDIIEDKI